MKVQGQVKGNQSMADEAAVATIYSIRGNLGKTSEQRLEKAACTCTGR